MTGSAKKQMSKDELLAEISHAASELAQYASYAETVGAVGYNATQIRTWCDKVFDLNLSCQKVLEEEAIPGRAESPWLVLKERDLLRQAIVRYGDRRRMGTVEPQELQQVIDDAFEAYDDRHLAGPVARAMLEAGFIDEVRFVDSKTARETPVIGETPWRWWAGVGDEHFTEGPFESRHDAVREATAQRLGEFQDEDGGWKLRFHVVEARQDPLRLADYLDVERLLETAEDSLENSGRLGELDDGGPCFECSPEQEKDLHGRLSAACDAWQEANGLRFAVKTFSHSSGGEVVVVPLPRRETGGEDTDSSW